MQSFEEPTTHNRSRLLPQRPKAMNMTMNLGQASLELSSPMSPPRPIPIPQPLGRSPPNNTPVHQPMTGSLFAQLQNDFLKFVSLEEVVSASIAAHKDRIDCSSAGEAKS